MGFGTSFCLKRAAFLKKMEFLRCKFLFEIYSLNDDATLIVYFFRLWDSFFAGFVSKWPAIYSFQFAVWYLQPFWEGYGNQRKVMIQIATIVALPQVNQQFLFWKNWGFTTTIIHFELLLEMYPPTRGPASCLSICQRKTEWETTAGHLVES